MCSIAGDALAKEALDSFIVSALIKRSSIEVFKEEEGYAGIWVCPLTNQIIRHSSFASVTPLISIDFALQNGGNSWPYSTVERFKNDMSNVIVVDKSIDDERGTYPPTSWLPPENVCAYTLQWDYVMTKYKLSYPLEGVFAFERLLKQCSADKEGN